MDIETQAEASTHPDLPEEQAYLDRAYECLEDMRQQAARGARIVVAGDPFAEEAIYQMFLSRLADLSEETALCFGRIDRVDGDLYSIGRPGSAPPTRGAGVRGWMPPPTTGRDREVRQRLKRQGRQPGHGYRPGPQPFVSRASAWRI
jgi:hypothetical protein